MEMKNDEILVRYRQAKKKMEQVEILADLNNCPVERIIGILTANGIDGRCFSKLRAKLNRQRNIVRKAGEVVNAEAVKEFDNVLIKGQQVEAKEEKQLTVVKAMATIYDKVAELKAQKQAIDDELAEIGLQLSRLEDIIAGRE